MITVNVAAAVGWTFLIIMGVRRWLARRAEHRFTVTYDLSDVTDSWRQHGDQVSRTQADRS